MQHQHADDDLAVDRMSGLAQICARLEIPAYDVQAACSGYLYALAQAWDFLQQHPAGHVLVVTTEAMRSIVDPRDPQTSPIFADAATATVLSCAPRSTRALARLRRPSLSAKGDSGDALRIPLPGPSSHVHMDGRRVFTEAVRGMNASLAAAYADSGTTVADLDLIVPHQANSRIIEAMRSRLKVAEQRVWNEIRHQAMHHPSSIPLALDNILRHR